MSAAPPIRLGKALEPGVVQEIRRAMELRHFKWDAQVGDAAVLCQTPLLIDSASWDELAELAERLFDETLGAERELVARPSLHSRIGLARPLRGLFARGVPTPSAARVMRFDFHWTSEGWRISEVNSDVPGGFTEASNFTSLVAEHVPGGRPTGDPTGALVAAIARTTGQHGVVGLVSAPGHMEDHQVVAHLAAALRERGLSARVISVHQLRWSGYHARIETAQSSATVDAIVRFYQVEWLARLPGTGGWPALFVDGCTPVTNPGIAALSESKRLPLVWDELRVPLPTWRRLLPETRALSAAPWTTDDSWLIKSAYGNTGETVSIRSAMTSTAWARRIWTARLYPWSWVAQRRFAVVPVFDEVGPLYPCIGVYVVEGKVAGAYARLTRGPIIDFRARDAALLICDRQ
jgi:glutathionylspermidine synthase